MAEPTPDIAPTAAPAAEPSADATSVAPVDAATPQVDTAVQAAAASDAAAPPNEKSGSQPQAAPDIDLSQLPLHTRSLLKVEVVVTVTLAHQRRLLSEITELGPGTLVKFEKTYDEPLELFVGNLPIAQGEVVKVGDKFGLRIGKIIRPHERFASVA